MFNYCLMSELTLLPQCESLEICKTQQDTFLTEQKSEFKDIEFLVHLITSISCLFIILFNYTLEIEHS